MATSSNTTLQTISARTGKKSHKKKLTSTNFSELETVEHSNPFKMPGVTTLPLSEITQKIVGCVVGDDVTAENPWTHVQKEKLEDNIDLHQASSEFLSIASNIHVYPEDQILIGWIPAGSIKNDYFYIVYTIEAKTKVLKIIEQLDKEMNERLQKSIFKPINAWKSLGSEDEVNLSLNQNFRPLIEINVESKYPLVDQTVNFQQRRVEDARDGYVELLSDPRYPVTTVEKKRVDVGVQAALLKENIESQTILTYPKNISTQYEYMLELLEPEEESTEKEKGDKIEIQVARKKIRPKITFSSETIDTLLETVYFNSNCNLYIDDYKLLRPLEVKYQNIDSSATLRHFLALTEVKTTKNNVACDASWYNFKSGILAVCYAQFSFADISYGVEKIDEVVNAVEGFCPVLLWSYNDGLKPKLYLQSPREVTCLGFCPFKENLLIGGCRNGQIIVWDITNKLEQVETREILTYYQQRNRMNLRDLMQWMKYTHNVAVVEPVLISSLKDSHTNMVTNLKWIHPKMEFTQNGKWIIKSDCSEKSLEFMSFSIDGSILLWDLGIDPPVETLQNKKKFKRIQKVPSALITTGSNFKKLQGVFKPYFKIIVKDGSDYVPILSVIKKSNMHKYLAVGNYDPDPEVRTEFIYDKVQNEPKECPLLVTTTQGKILKLKWSGYNYALGQKLNTQEATIETFQSVHDGPIISCHIHPHYSDFIMTVGGTIFSVWSVELPVAIFWRKAFNGTKYMSAAWIYNHPSYLSTVRSDGAYEIWDLHFSGINALRTVYLGGDLKNVLGALAGAHAMKGTFAVADSIGSVALFHLPALLNVHSTVTIQQQAEKTLGILQRAVHRKKSLMDWIKKFESKYYEKQEESVKKLVQSVASIKADKESKQKTVAEVEKLNNIFNDFTWDKDIMEKYEELLIRKRLNLKELNKQRQPLIKLEEEKQTRIIKLKEILADKDKIMEATCNTLLKEQDYIKKRVYTMEEDQFSYIDNYEEIEEKMLWMIYSKPFFREIDFTTLIEEGRIRQRRINKFLEHTNVRSGRSTVSTVNDANKMSEELTSSHIDKSSTSKENGAKIGT